MEKVGSFLLGTVAGVVALGALAFLVDSVCDDSDKNSKSNDLAFGPENLSEEPVDRKDNA